LKSKKKDVEEDEYASPGRYREQELVRTCPNSDAEWTSELQGERPKGPVSRAGAATVIKAKGIASFIAVPARVRLAFIPWCLHQGIFFRKQSA
jgi:hypothetical protein